MNSRSLFKGGWCFLWNEVGAMHWRALLLPTRFCHRPIRWKSRRAIQSSVSMPKGGCTRHTLIAKSELWSAHPTCKELTPHEFQ